MAEWRTLYEHELQIVFTEAEAIISSFPKPLANRGLDYLAKFNPLKPGSTTNHICYLLPFWMKEPAGIDNEACRKLSLGNVFIMLYFFVQDDLMDTSPSDWKERLALGNLFHTALLDIYRSIFHSDSPFWSYYREYVTDWAVSVTAERSQNDKNVLTDNPILLAHKAGPVKLASTSALLIGGKHEHIPAASHLVDEALIALQMADDWFDWGDDLQEGSGNSLLAWIRAELPADERLTAQAVNSAICFRGSLNRFAAYAAGRLSLLEHTSFQVPHLLAFHRSLIGDLLTAAENVELRKRSLARGGFIDWLSRASYK